MQPRKPINRDAILRSAPSATAAEIEEYELLISKRFSKDPSLKKVRASLVPDPEEVRLNELTKKLFGTP